MLEEMTILEEEDILENGIHILKSLLEEVSEDCQPTIPHWLQ